MNFIDLIQDNDFRNDIVKRIQNHLNEPSYHFPECFPLLYKYRTFNQHSINDLLNDKVTVTSIGNFNDLFDSTFHSYGQKKDIDQKAEQEWAELEELIISTGVSENILSHDYVVEQKKELLRKDSRLSFRELDYLCVKASCFSKTNDSILMWSHYADENRGICIEYDFNEIKSIDWLHKCLFPVAYSDTPMDLSDLLNKKLSPNNNYALEKAILCATLSKSNIWKYEHEWRLFFPPIFLNKDINYLPININIKPKRIYLGYHFLKNFFYKNINDKEKEIEQCKSNLLLFKEFLDFIKVQNIPVCVMAPNIGHYELCPKNISTNDLERLCFSFFNNWKPKHMKYYYVAHDRLMDLLENTN